MHSSFSAGITDLSNALFIPPTPYSKIQVEDLGISSGVAKLVRRQ
jgi:hypothetical protein